jgi:hypothetical protein
MGPGVNRALEWETRCKVREVESQAYLVFVCPTFSVLLKERLAALGLPYRKCCKTLEPGRVLKRALSRLSRSTNTRRPVRGAIQSSLLSYLNLFIHFLYLFYPLPSLPPLLPSAHSAVLAPWDSRALGVQLRSVAAKTRETGIIHYIPSCPNNMQ